MTDIKRIGDSGIHTVEGNVAGARAAQLTKERDQQQAEYQAVKNKIKEDNAQGIGRIDQKFNVATDSLEQEFRRKTVGLVTADDFRKAREIVDAVPVTAAKDNTSLKKLEADKKLEKDNKRKKIASALSFSMDDDGEENVEETFQVKKKVLKNPAVDTSFLPDAARDREIAEKKEALRIEWLQQQEILKNESLEVVYSYWDGSGHRKEITVTKGLTIGKFLEKVKVQLASEFSEMRSMNAEDLIYVKEDIIIPQHYSFYDLIVTKARGKSGPLFHFDVHDDIRMVNDATIEKDESHPGKVVDRRWFERNKHIFPYNRWELYDPNVKREKYTIHGGETASDAKRNKFN